MWISPETLSRNRKENEVGDSANRNIHDRFQNDSWSSEMFNAHSQEMHSTL